MDVFERTITLGGFDGPQKNGSNDSNDNSQLGESSMSYKTENTQTEGATITKHEFDDDFYDPNDFLKKYFDMMTIQILLKCHQILVEIYFHS